MDLVPCNAKAREQLTDSLFDVNGGFIDKKLADYVARTFPDILMDIAHLLTERATTAAREQNNPTDSVLQQLKPFLMFNSLLGKCPQMTSLVYNYFEKSSFQPFPENAFKLVGDKDIEYNIPGFNDELVKEILISYFRYLAFNPKWFSTVWNWALLGKFIAVHPNKDIRYLAACCLSVITRPTRLEHISFMNGIDKHHSLIDLQIRHRHLFDNTFKPCLEPNQKVRAEQYAAAVGRSDTGYEHSTESLTKVANVLLLKRDVSLEDESDLIAYKNTINSFVPVATLHDTISRIAYSISISKPCLIRGPCGSGKTAILDYVAAHTNRINPPDYVKVQIGDQIDSKMLIGSYICTEIPGQFEWQPGPLTSAMLYGSWIVFEDIDSAPADMAQVIHSVIENGHLACVSSCPVKLDMPHPDFRILFTQQVKANKQTDSFSLGHGFIERLCDIVDLPELSDKNLQEILETKYKFNGELVLIILQLYNRAKKAMEELNISRASRSINLRDLFKFCDRIVARNLHTSNSGRIASSDLEAMYLDAIDCFLSAISRTRELDKWADELGQIVNMSANEVQRLVFQRKPDIRECSDHYQAGRAKLELSSKNSSQSMKQSTMAYTRQCLQLIESVSVCINNREPVLLVGETGVGKTSIVQHLANITKTELIVINLSQQSDTSDLLGGYKPVELREVMRPLHDKFDKLFRKTFDENSNEKFLYHISNLFATAKTNSKWTVYLKLVCKMCTTAFKNKEASRSLLDSWNELYDTARTLSKRIVSENETRMALKFSDGSLVNAVRGGKWILLDEINLAEPDVLQCLLLILDSMKKRLVYMYDASDNREPIKIHPNFRIFACMNPSTDIGKRDLATGTRGRFTEFYVDDVTEKPDLRLIVESYAKTCLNTMQIDNIVKLYQEVRDRASILSDISGNAPIYSLRTLCRALTICSNNVCHNIEKSLFESLKITFLQQLNEESVQQVTNLITQLVFNKKSAISFDGIAIPRPKDNHNYIQVEGFWVPTNTEEPWDDPKYVRTPSIERNLQSLARIISLSQRKLPILIQGNTSVGKTSLIAYLAKLTGNRCYRINNHEHTDLQDYVGQYILREDGELYFQEGLLVRAMKKGYWIILDELNLAPCELLEALNRVLDENRELFIPETGQTLRSHHKFMLFATQNPPEEYAGRKLLSRAFRNRFIELHFDDIPTNELEYILEKRCTLAPQYAKKIVTVMRELQLFRRESGCFNGKNGFMTMRDLFRWGQRYESFKSDVPDGEFYDWDTALAKEGVILLEGRVRTINEAETVKKIIEKVFKVTLSYDDIYGEEYSIPKKVSQEFGHIQFTKEFKKMYVQLSHALKYKEPVLLCGQTGCGKTTACQLYAVLKTQKLLTYNCHLNTESSDFVGGVRPTREETPDSSSKQSFPWIDGPLVAAMRTGAIFLLDEISLADDAVLERINSVLESTRSIMLTEKSGEEINASDTFRLVATMNPGGDYGKKELSAALRNRFTEIYCHNTTDLYQVRKIITACLSPPLLKSKYLPRIVSVMYDFLKEYYKNHEIVSIRDVKSWVDFINKVTMVDQSKPLSIQEALLNGASLVFFDQFGTCGHIASSMNADYKLKSELRIFLRRLLKRKFNSVPAYSETCFNTVPMNGDIVFFQKYVLTKGPEPIYDNIKDEFILEAPRVKKNLIKIARALKLDRPILLEGDPGAGKTSMVSALAKLTGHKIARINLSEQTDISDLFGSDLPSSTEDGESPDMAEAPQFKWHDGPMLQAIKESQWILLDEMNLASQSVLEGLNSCFDHRGEIFISELNKRFKIDLKSTKIFACQNPYRQGASRKGLPQSFLNRFTSIYIESHTPKDLAVIVKRLYPGLPNDLIDKMIEFNNEISENYKCYGFEFNLRDIIYWCDLMTKYVRNEDETIRSYLHKPERFVQFIYLDRLRVPMHKLEFYEIFDRIFGFPVYEPPYREIKLGEHSFILGRSTLTRNIRVPPHLSDLCILKYQMPYLESIAKAIESNKMPIVVGESGLGKRSMIRILAGLTGNELNIVGANREMDTVELLGSFEQKSIQREVVKLIEDSKQCVMAMINSIPCKTSINDWSKLFAHIWQTLYLTSIRDLKLSNSESMEAYRYQLTQMKDLVGKLQPISTNTDPKACKLLITKINHLIGKSSSNNEPMYSSGNFEWIDSILIKSIREGTWLMIENANLMNPATLDRLNCLVEPNGCLSLNEKGSGPNGIETLIPHQNFRLILTMDPEHGELSRAMRNRGVEIFVQAKFYYEDFLILLNQNGFEPEEMKACMAYCIMQTSHDVHKKITGEEPGEGGSLLAYFGLNYISILTHQVRRGMKIDDILIDLLTSYYCQKGFTNECDDTLRTFIIDRLNEYRKTFEVNLDDERYKWRNFRHDLVSLTGGDAITAMLDREHKIFYDDVNTDLLLNRDEFIENIDIVNTCIMVKLFLEHATHGDFEYREGFIRETFSNCEQLVNTVNSHVEELRVDYENLMTSLLPKKDIITISDMPVDSRNAPDIHYNLLSLDYSGTKDREKVMNKWVLSLNKIMLRMIVELTMDRSEMDPENEKSLYDQSQQVEIGNLHKENLVKPTAAVATDLYDLLNGLVRVVSTRSLDNKTVVKILPKFFWIHYIIAKLKRGFRKIEQIAICNQLPMLWSLTYHKIIVPLIQECDIADVPYKSKKFSVRIQEICDFLKMTTAKPGDVEKSYHKKIVNLYASITKRHDHVSKETDRFFTTLASQYTTRPSTIQKEQFVDAVQDAASVISMQEHTLAVSYIIWSNGPYMDKIYEIEDKLLSMDCFDRNNDESNAKKFEDEARFILNEKTSKYEQHKTWYDGVQGDSYKNRHLYSNMRMIALDQFAPIWQLNFIQIRLSKLFGTKDPANQSVLLKEMLESVHGLVMSPRYYSTAQKYLLSLKERAEKAIQDEADTNRSSLKDDLNMYTTILVDYFLENIVLDHQIVGWTRLRVTTSDLPSLAPLVPEYSPIISLVGSYCLDLAHLKLNSYTNPSAQLESMLIYLCRHYSNIKLDKNHNSIDLKHAIELLHLRCKTDLKEELIGSYECDNSTNNSKDGCHCIYQYIKRRIPTYENLIETLDQSAVNQDIEDTQKSIDLIYFGYLNLLEFAPLFTMDPSLRAREILGVYNAELAHVKLELHLRNTLLYWKTGENLQLNELEADDAIDYPFSIQALVARRAKLEKSIKKLKKDHTNRPKSDDASIYLELRKDVEVSIHRYTIQIQSVVNDLISYAESPKVSEIKLGKFKILYTNVRRTIKNSEKMITHLRSTYPLYADLTTNFLVGMCFVQQGLRCFYSKLEQRMEVYTMFGAGHSIQKYMTDIDLVFSFNKFNQGNLHSVYNKLQTYQHLGKLCPEDRVSQMQSILLRTVLIQLNHHITITPSDIQECIPLVRFVADKFHAAWLKRKLYLEEQRKLKEDLFQYKTVRNAIGTEISFERQEFLDMCAKFPTYDHVYQSFDYSKQLTSAEIDNLRTEERICNLNRSVDLSMCIDICKAHYKLIKAASYNLLGQLEDQTNQTPNLDLSQLIELEAETLYTITRHCIPTLDRSFDSKSLECHILQATRLIKTFRQTKEDQCKTPLGGLKSSLEILDEEIFDIYHHANAQETLKFQDFISKVNDRVRLLRNQTERNYESHPTLIQLTKLTARISSFLVTDPMMKFITGSHTLLGVMEEWNKQSIPREDKMITEVEELINLIKSWRALEIDSWKSSLHGVKRRYIDNTLCDLWFKLYEAFNDPVTMVTKLLAEKFSIEYSFEDDPETLYQGFVLFIKDFLEDSTLGDYQIRLDLVFSFAIQTRFSSFNEQPKTASKIVNNRIDFDKLNTYVYNTHRQYAGFFGYLKEIVDMEEKILVKELHTEIRIVAWQGRNLWEIKNNFRISHRKLNKVMNKYLELLRRPVPPADPSAFTKIERIPNQDDSSVNLESDRLTMTLASIQMLIGNVRLPSKKDQSIKCIESLNKTPKIVKKMIDLFNEIYPKMVERYLGNLVVIENTVYNHTETIQNYYSHNVKSVIMDPKDTKETRAEKQKLCRQMYHAKKYAMQSVFKSLQTLGVSHQRGLNQMEDMDKYILALEPLRGMIQTQSRSVLKSAKELVDEDIIEQCNSSYRKMIAGILFMLSNESAGDLTGDQMERIRGYTVDLALGIIHHNESAALIYKHLIDIQAAIVRLTTLAKNTKTQNIVIYNFKRFHKLVQQFNELVGRAYLATSKLEKLVECSSLAYELGTSNSDGSKPSQEKFVIDKLITDLDDEQQGNDTSLMTEDQLKHIRSSLPNIQKNIAEVSYNLRDMLNNTIKNHVYSRDDLDHLVELYGQFYDAFSCLISRDESDEYQVNPGTAFGSFSLLLDEADEQLKPKLVTSFWEPENEPTPTLDEHPNLEKLNLRLRKLIRETQLAVQGVYEEESNHLKDLEGFQGESAKRKLKPFNQLSSGRVESLLRAKRVARFASNCFVTLNQEEKNTNIRAIITGFAPALFIYTQDVACYLNIILTTLQTKLAAANQLLPFFTDLIVNGFGLPYKVSETDGSAQGTNGKMSEDNVGFGEGKGDNDASKKLEFESQLDDLKQDKDKADKRDDDDESVKPHDDGIEMSDDIDARAEGGENGNENDGQDDDQPEEEDQDEALDDLDKELDSVDQDEGKLDQKLWDEEDSPLGEDDENDLRETDVDGSSQPNNEDGKELEAKDDQLTTSENKIDADKIDPESADGDDPKNDDSMDENPEDEKDLKEKKVDPTAGDQIEENDDINAAPDDKAVDKNIEDECLDMDEEAAEATKEPESASQPDIIDMSMSDAEDQSEIDADSEKTKETASQEEEEKKSEGEISMDEDENDDEELNVGDKSEKINNESSKSNSQDPICDDEIDNKLEELLSSNVSADDKSGNQLQQTILTLPAKGPDTNKKQTPNEMQGRRIGQYTAYDIYTEEDDDPLDYDDIDEADGEEVAGEKQSSNEAKENIAESPPKDSSNGPENTPMDAETMSDISLPEHDPRLDEKLSDDKMVDRNKTEEDPAKSKRTFADRDEEDDKGIKRQRILSAQQENNKREHTDDSKKQSPPGGQVRHIDEDKSGAVEVIDLVSSSDEDESDLPILKHAQPAQEEDSSDSESDNVSDSREDNTELMKQIDNELGKRLAAESDSIDADRLTTLWLDCTKQTNHLVHELCQRLQIVLQPTKMSKYRGDYKSGKRLNMRKIISYIASHYRKDKIWLRRTKPSKRTYNIAIAVDNSSSMSENNCRQMTYQSLALLAKSLSIIEAGSLSVVSFGEQVRCIHEFDLPYMDAVGAQWLRELRFDERRTSYCKLLKYCVEAFAKQAQATLSQLNTQGNGIYQLLVIISDGRNVTSEEEEVKMSLRELKSMGVLVLFVIIDDLKMNEGKSIVDVKRCIGFGSNVQMLSYMELFPFPFYVLLRQLDTMPSILGDSLRQWFELVSSASR